MAGFSLMTRIRQLFKHQKFQFWGIIFLVFCMGIETGARVPRILEKRFYSGIPVIQRHMEACPLANPDTKVIVVFGQSNSANFGGTNSDGASAGNWGTDLYQAKRDVIVLDWRNGKCFPANDPLPGADGRGASIWGRFGDEVIARHLANQVVIVSFGVGATTIADWTGATKNRNGEHYEDRLGKVALAIQHAGYHTDFVAFQQGESDRTTTYAAYRAGLEKLADRVKNLFGTKMTVAISTLCQAPPNEDVAKADRDVSDAGLTRLGPDFDVDVANVLDRFDRCHMSGLGLHKSAELWADSFQNSQTSSTGTH